MKLTRIDSKLNFTIFLILALAISLNATRRSVTNVPGKFMEGQLDCSKNGKVSDKYNAIFLIDDEKIYKESTFLMIGLPLLVSSECLQSLDVEEDGTTEYTFITKEENSNYIFREIQYSLFQVQDTNFDINNKNQATVTLATRNTNAQDTLRLGIYLHDNGIEAGRKIATKAETHFRKLIEFGNLIQRANNIGMLLETPLNVDMLEVYFEKYDPETYLKMKEEMGFDDKTYSEMLSNLYQEWGSKNVFKSEKADIQHKAQVHVAQEQFLDLFINKREELGIDNISDEEVMKKEALDLVDQLLKENRGLKAEKEKQALEIEQARLEAEKKKIQAEQKSTERARRLEEENKKIEANKQRLAEIDRLAEAKLVAEKMQAQVDANNTNLSSKQRKEAQQKLKEFEKVEKPEKTSESKINRVLKFLHLKKDHKDKKVSERVVEIPAPQPVSSATVGQEVQTANIIETPHELFVFHELLPYAERIKQALINNEELLPQPEVSYRGKMTHFFLLDSKLQNIRNDPCQDYTPGKSLYAFYRYITKSFCDDLNKFTAGFNRIYLKQTIQESLMKVLKNPDYIVVLFDTIQPFFDVSYLQSLKFNRIQRIELKGK